MTKPLWSKSFIAITLSTFFLFLGFYLLLPSMPLYVQALGGDEAQVGIVIGSFMFTAVLARPFVGVWLDQKGRRQFVILGLALFGLVMFLHIWAAALPILIILRLLHGVSWAVSTTALATAVTDTIPPGRLGEGMGWYGISSTIAMAIGPLLSVWLVERFSYDAVFFVGTILLMGALACTFLADPAYEKTATVSRPVLILPNLLPISSVVFFFAMVYAGVTTFLPVFADVIEVNPGIFFTVYAIALALTRFVSGRLADRYGDGAAILPGLACAIVTMFVLSATTGVTGIVSAAVVFGIGYGSAHPILQAATVRLVKAGQRGMANATFISAFDLGIGCGSIALGWLLRATGYPVLFLTTALIGAIALMIYGSIFRQQRSQPATYPHTGQ